MEAVFLKILNMSITASWLVLAVIVIRFLLKKAPKAFSVILWALVGIRLILPFSLESVLSLVPSAEVVPSDIVYSSVPEINSGISALNSAVNPIISQSLAPDEVSGANPVQNIALIASAVWIAGIAAMLLYTLISYLRFRRKVREAAPLNDNIYLCDGIGTPFILGVIRPRIYLPSDISVADTEYVIAHERAHLKRRDHLWKPLGFLLLAVYWFNPVLWVAYILLCRDIELACDEKVINDRGAEIKKSYSEALVNCSVPRKTIAACPLAFGEGSVKGRIKSVLNYKKPAFWIIAVSVIACIAVSVCFLTNPIAEKAGLQGDGDNNDLPIASEIDSEALELEGLRAKYPQFFDLDTKNGLNVYVWQMSESSYYCGLLSDKEEAYSFQELIEMSHSGGTTVDEMKTILSSYGIPKSDIEVIPYQNPLSSYITAPYLDPDPDTYNAYMYMLYEMLGLNTFAKDVEILDIQTDIDHNGAKETLELEKIYQGTTEQNKYVELFLLNFKEGDKVIHSEEAAASHSGWNALFLYQKDGEDYLLRYNPYMMQGGATYKYQLFYVAEDGSETAVQGNSVSFDTNFGSSVHEWSGFEPKAIDAFLSEINALLPDSIELINTDDDLIESFKNEGRQYHIPQFLFGEDRGFDFDYDKSMLENLEEYKAALEAFYAEAE